MRTDESPERVAAVQRLTWAYFRGARYLEDSAWPVACAALAGLNELGWVACKGCSPEARLICEVDTGWPGEAGWLEISVLRVRKRIAPPDIFQGFGQGLLFDGVVGVACIAGEEELVVVALGR